MPTKFLAVNGVHAAGKSTVLGRLSERGCDTKPEIASLLIEEHSYDWGRHGSETFQAAIFEREVQRDRQLIEAEAQVAVETWHYGNLAHCIETGTQELVTKERDYLDSLSVREDVEMAALYISIPIEEIPRRSSHITDDDGETLEFYRRIEDRILELYESYDVNYRVVENEFGELDSTVEAASAFAETVLSP